MSIYAASYIFVHTGRDGLCARVVEANYATATSAPSRNSNASCFRNGQLETNQQNRGSGCFKGSVVGATSIAQTETNYEGKETKYHDNYTN